MFYTLFVDFVYFVLLSISLFLKRFGFLGIFCLAFFLVLFVFGFIGVFCVGAFISFASSVTGVVFFLFFRC